MNEKQKQVLKKAYDSLNVELDSDDYDAIGKIVVARRMLAELLSLPLQSNLLPGEELGEELSEKLVSKDVEQENLTASEKSYLKYILKITDNVGSSYDMSNSCLRCARRMIAEVVGDIDLSIYFLLGNNSNEPIYYKD